MNATKLQLQANWLEDKHFASYAASFANRLLFDFAMFVDLVLFAINIIIIIIVGSSAIEYKAKK